MEISRRITRAAVVGGPSPRQALPDGQEAVAIRAGRERRASRRLSLSPDGGCQSQGGPVRLLLLRRAGGWKATVPVAGGYYPCTHKTFRNHRQYRAKG